MDVEESSFVVEDPAFRLSGRVSREGNIVEIAYEYASLRDWVSPADLKAYAANVARARGMVGVDVRPRTAGPLDTDWMKTLLAALLILGGGYVLLRRLRA
jgi:hypothetical protein